MNEDSSVRNPEFTPGQITPNTLAVLQQALATQVVSVDPTVKAGPYQGYQCIYVSGSNYYLCTYANKTWKKTPLGTVISPYISSTLTDLAGQVSSFTITPSTSYVAVGAIGSITCAAIGSGTYSGQLLIIQGRYTNTTTVTIPTTLSNIVLKGGNAVLSANSILTLIWDTGESPYGNGKWVEVSRSI